MQAGAAATRAAGCLLLGLPCSMRQWSGLRMMSVLAGARIWWMTISSPTSYICSESSNLAIRAEHYPVAICGGGPTGQTLAALLGKYGIASVLLERSTTPPQHPQVSSEATTSAIRLCAHHAQHCMI